jgi:hypothetical protein
MPALSAEMPASDQTKAIRCLIPHTLRQRRGASLSRSNSRMTGAQPSPAPSLPDVVTNGRAEVKARERPREAILLHLDGLRALGLRLPDGGNAGDGVVAIDVPH